MLFSHLQVKKLFVHKDGSPLQVYERLLAGSTAGVIAQTTIYPMEVSTGGRGGGEGMGREGVYNGRKRECVCVCVCVCIGREVQARRVGG